MSPAGFSTYIAAAESRPRCLIGRQRRRLRRRHAVSFGLNARFNFRVTDRLRLRLVCFFGVALLGWAVSAACCMLLIGDIGCNKYLSKLATLVVIVVLQYNLNRRLSFRKTALDVRAKKNPHCRRRLHRPDRGAALVAGYRFSVILVESSPGNWADWRRDFRSLGTSLEKTYHHLFLTDTDILDLVENWASRQIVWCDSSVAIYRDGTIHAFKTPLDLLRFYPVQFHGPGADRFHGAVSQAPEGLARASPGDRARLAHPRVRPQRDGRHLDAAAPGEV